ncbi:MAG: hypothetical protein M1814_005057 [Vezdaea aestivalis]|nr:MAG: hypothetical protein M1814_005057 [Vezdaea aestivalis]
MTNGYMVNGDFSSPETFVFSTKDVCVLPSGVYQCRHGVKPGMSIVDHHRVTVTVISAQVKEFYKQKKPFRIYHGSTNATRDTTFQRDSVVDTSPLRFVLNIDQKNKTVLVEPNVSMEQLVSITLPFGLVPLVVPEFRKITVGGAFAGTGGESSSYKHGFFDSTVEKIEMVLATGEVVMTSESERPDLFHGAAGTFGSLGVTTLLTVRLIEAKLYVQLTYQPVQGMPQALERIKAAAKNPKVDFIDGILYALDKGVIITGKMTNDAVGSRSIQYFSRAQDPWFYLHAESLLKRDPSTAQIISTPIKDYLFRYDRGAFWTGTYAFRYFLMPFNWVTRFLFAYFFQTHVMYHAMHKSGHSKKYIIQDTVVPFRSAQRFVEYLDNSLGIFPLWLCPIKPSAIGGMNPRSLWADPNSEGGEDEMLLNIGVWGPGPKNQQKFITKNVELEKELNKLGGTKWLYAQTYYTEEEFWQTYDRELYDALREKYDAESLPDVYTKVKVNLKALETPVVPDRWLLKYTWHIWPISGLYGVLHAIFRSDYLLSH